MTPERIQRTRKASHRYPAGNVLTVTRKRKTDPGVFGNPFRVCQLAGVRGWVVLRGDALIAANFTTKRAASQFAVDRYREYMAEYAETQPDLYGLTMRCVLSADYIGCWCGLDDPCHGDVLIELAAEWKERCAHPISCRQNAICLKCGVAVLPRC